VGFELEKEYFEISQRRLEIIENQKVTSLF
jgi:hypothetical protein